MLDTEHYETRAIEAEIAAAEGHDLGCFEDNAERMIDEGLIEEGYLGEITTAGVAMETQMFREMAEGTRECQCYRESTED